MEWVHLTVGTKIDETWNTCYWFLWYPPRSDICLVTGTCAPTVHHPRALLIADLGNGLRQRESVASMIY